MVDVGMYVQAYITVGCSILGIWGLVKVFKDIKHTNDDEVKRRKRWDDTAQVVEDNKDAWNKGLSDVDKVRDKIVENYDGRLDNMDAKIQQLYAMTVLLIKSQNVMLEEQAEKGNNGEIKKIHKELNDFVVEQLGQ